MKLCRPDSMCIVSHSAIDIDISDDHAKNADLDTNGHSSPVIKLNESTRGKSFTTADLIRKLVKV